MMQKENTYAKIADIVSAVELVYEDSQIKVSPNALNIYDAISLVNMGAIKETDSVLVMSLEIETIAWSIAYLYMPRVLAIKKVDTVEANSDWILKFRQIQREVDQLLRGYMYTESTLLCSKMAGVHQDCQPCDVIIVGSTIPLKASEDRIIYRFDIETGEEYEIYEKSIVEMSKILKKGGRALVLCKPSWILKSWELIHELGLQLEYQEYSLYMDNNRHPNGLVWLRFVKVEQDFNIDKQKRNVLSLMKDNNIDRLYAHKNNLVFPYVELSYKKSESYVQLDQDLQHMQYFFSLETTKRLATLCNGYTACLVTPSIARYAHEHNKNVVLFERDNRFRKKGDVKFVKYDLNTGLTKFTQSKYANKFDVVICDPPFNIRLEILAKDVAELLKHNRDSIAYIVFPEKNRISLINAMISEGLSLSEDKNNIDIEYGRPPKLVRIHGKQAIQLYKFLRLES